MLQAIYDRMFTSVVECINEAIEVKKSAGTGRQTVIGVLDIYGFEIFDNNRYIIIVIVIEVGETRMY